MAVMKSLVLAGIVAVGVQDVNAAVEVPKNYATAVDAVPPPLSTEEGWIFASGDTQERDPVKHSSGYWPCLRVPEGLDERYPVWSTGGWFNSNKFCDFSKQPGKAMFSCRGMYTLYKTKEFPQLPSPHCFAQNISNFLTKEFVDAIDAVQNSGELCTRFIGKGRVFTPLAIYKPVSDEWIAHRTTLDCPADVWSLNAATKDTFCNQVTAIDDMQTCDYAKDKTTRVAMHACWDVCADTLSRCKVASEFGMGALLSSQNLEPKAYIDQLNPAETIDSWCMFLSQDSVCYGMDYYYPEGKLTRNSCYPDGVNSKEVKAGLPADHAFAGTKGNFFRTDGKTQSVLTATAESAPKPAGFFESSSMVRSSAAAAALMAISFLLA